MKKLGVITLIAVCAFLAVSVVPAGAQTAGGATSVSVPTAGPESDGTPAPASVTSNLNLFPSLPPQPTPAAMSSSDSFHKFDVFAGYSFLNNDIAVVDAGEFQQLVHGYAASVTFNLNKNFGILADFSGNNGSLTLGTTHQTEDQYYFLFGPTVSHSFGKGAFPGMSWSAPPGSTTVKRLRVMRLTSVSSRRISRQASGSI